MNKYLTIASLSAVSVKAEAHSHSSVDSLTHSLEHFMISYQAWLPYVLGVGVLLTVAAGLNHWWNRRSIVADRRQQ